MERIPVVFRRLSDRTPQPVPAYQTEGSAGMDLHAAERRVLGPGARALVSTGIAVAVPPGFEAQVRPRSGLAWQSGITVLNAPGTIDSDYRGELKVLLANLGEQDFVVEPGARIAQLVLAPVARAEMCERAALPRTERGGGGFGSTGQGVGDGGGMELSEDQFVRYARHLILEEVGDEGQEKLLASSVLCVGAGGLGSPVLLYLAAAGVGTLGIIDDDSVDLSNLQRQIVHATGAVGMPKTRSARETLERVNPTVDVRIHEARLGPDNVADLFSGYDLIVAGSDNFATRYLIHDAAHLAGKTVVSGSLLRFEGQLTTYRSGVKGHAGEPCYRCLFREPPPAGTVPRCEEAGIFGAVAGVIGTLQATEVLKELIGIGESMSGRLLIFDALGAGFRTVRYRRSPGCPLCGDTPTITVPGHG